MKRTALVPLATHPEAAEAESLTTVADFAARIGCSIHALPLIVDIPDVSNALSRVLLDVPEMIRDAERRSRRIAGELESTLKSKAGQAGVDFASETRAAGPEIAGEIAAEEARYFDLSLIPMPPGNQPCRDVAEAVVFGSGRPAVLLPTVVPDADRRRIVIAWDGSPVAARAAWDALCLLGEVEDAVIVSVLNEKPLPAEDLGDRLAARLGARGIRATAESVELEDQPIGFTLQDFALRKGAGLLVMGAYGHSRLRDFVLGGATRTILEDLRMPVLMSR